MWILLNSWINSEKKKKKRNKRNVFNLETINGHNKIGKKSLTNNGATPGVQVKTGVTRELRNSWALPVYVLHKTRN